MSSRQHAVFVCLMHMLYIIKILTWRLLMIERTNIIVIHGCFMFHGHILFLLEGSKFVYLVFVFSSLDFVAAPETELSSSWEGHIASRQASHCIFILERSKQQREVSSRLYTTSTRKKRVFDLLWSLWERHIFVYLCGLKKHRKRKPMWRILETSHLHY